MSLEDLSFENEFTSLTGGDDGDHEYDVPPELDDAVERGWITQDQLRNDPSLRRRKEPEPEPEPEAKFDVAQFVQGQQERDAALVQALARIGSQPASAQEPQESGPAIPFVFKMPDELAEKFDDETRAGLEAAMNAQGSALAEQVAQYVDQRAGAAHNQAVQQTQQNAADERWFRNEYPEANVIPDEMQQEMAQQVIQQTAHMPISNRDRLRIFGERIRQRKQSLERAFGATFSVGSRDGGMGAGGARSSVQRRRRVDPNGAEAIGSFIDSFARI